VRGAVPSPCRSVEEPEGDAALAGDYPPPEGSADEITDVITVGHDTVRIAPNPIPENEKVRQELEPLLKALGEVGSVGEGRMPRSCRSNRLIGSTG